MPFTVTGTDPEDGPIDCSQVTVTFVLVHDQHGHGEDSETGCTGTLSTIADDASHGGYIAGGISVTYTDDGRERPAAADHHASRTSSRSAASSSSSPRSSPGTTTGNVGGGEPDPGGGQIRNGLDEGDWIAINRFVNLTNMNKEITLRFAANGAAATTARHRRVPPRQPGRPVGRHRDAAEHRRQQHLHQPDVPAGLHGIAAGVPGLQGRSPGNATTGNFGNLNWVEFSGAGHGVPPTP